MDILRERDVEFDVITYLETPLDEDTLREIADKVDVTPAELVRKDKNFKDLGLDAANYITVDAVVKLLIEHPRLMQRPIAVRGERAVVGRPSEKVEQLL
ncbi:MAG: arsenate reductase [Gammaproteobacteria bacterium]|nr:arsenate reductase [Gammaproteobacteria bacterium]